jgi:hypothetical protein
MPAIIFLVAVGHQDAPWFAGTENRYYFVGLGSLEVRIDEIIATSVRRLQDRHAPLLRPVRYPVLILLGNVTEFIAGHALALAGWS